jgi:transposase-like protein
VAGDRIDRRQYRLHRRDVAPAGAPGRASSDGLRDGPGTVEQQRIKALEREVRELRKANEILKLASAFFAQAELDRRCKS